MKPNLGSRIYDFILNYFSLSGQLVSQQEAEANIREGVSFKGTNILILILAILIASLGLNTNSTAVIIGAMLISPLMGPIIGIGLGVGIHDFELLKRCLRNLLMAAGFSVIAATLYFLISPVNEQHSELLARTSPTIYDVLIAFVGGGAGIIALGSTNKGNVIPGVAIATALMPPLCTAGYGLATWQLNYFFGASYLFIINSIYIAFATFIGVKLMKYHGVSNADSVRATRVRRIVYVLAILTMLPSIYLTYGMLRQNKFVVNADNFIHNECVFPDTQVLNRKAYIENGKKYLSLTLIGRTLPIDSLREALLPKMKFYGLQGTDLIFIQGGNPDKTPSKGTDVYSPSVDGHLQTGAGHNFASASTHRLSREHNRYVEKRARRRSGARSRSQSTVPLSEQHRHSFYGNDKSGHAKQRHNYRSPYKSEAPLQERGAGKTLRVSAGTA